MSNALQQLHHSFNFYFFTGPSSHISNGSALNLLDQVSVLEEQQNETATLIYWHAFANGVFAFCYLAPVLGLHVFYLGHGGLMNAKQFQMNHSRRRVSYISCISCERLCRPFLWLLVIDQKDSIESTEIRSLESLESHGVGDER